MRIDRFEDFDPDDPDIEFRKKRWDYWGTLKKVRTEYFETMEEFSAADFAAYVERNYGLKMHIVDGQITDKFDIVDEKLYTFFILKWM